MTRHQATVAGAGAVLLALGLIASPASAATPSVSYSHRCGWWNDWCNGNTTTTTTTAPSPPTPTTTTAPPTTTATTAPPTTTTTKAPTTTTLPPTTTTKAPTTTTLPPTTTTTTQPPVQHSTKPPPPPTTTTTLPPTTTTTRADTVGFFADFAPPRGSLPEQVSAVTDAGSGLQLLVSLAGAFVAMTVQGLGYYLFVFLVPVLAALWLTVVRHREEQESGLLHETT